MKKTIFAFIAVSALVLTAQGHAQNVVINFDDYTTSGAEGLPEPPGAYAGFVWQHVFYADGTTPRVVSNTQLSLWSAPGTATSGVYQLYTSESEAKITITRSSGGSFNFVSGQFAKYNNATVGATTIWITGNKSGGGTVSASFGVTTAINLKLSPT